MKFIFCEINFLFAALENFALYIQYVTVIIGGEAPAGDMHLLHLLACLLGWSPLIICYRSNNYGVIMS